MGVWCVCVRERADAMCAAGCKGDCKNLVERLQAGCRLWGGVWSQLRAPGGRPL